MEQTLSDMKTEIVSLSIISEENSNENCEIILCQRFGIYNQKTNAQKYMILCRSDTFIKTLLTQN